MKLITKEEISNWFRQLQLHICTELEAEDGKAKFVEDAWERPGGGGGQTRVIQHGNVFEKGGHRLVYTSARTPLGMLPPLVLPVAGNYHLHQKICSHHKLRSSKECSYNLQLRSALRCCCNSVP